MKLRYFFGRIDETPMSFEQMAEVTKALAVLERFGKDGLIRFEVSDNLRDIRRMERGDDKPRRLHPQHETIMTALRKGQWMSAEEIAASANLSTNSVRPRLVDLVDLRYAERRQERRGATGRPINLYRALEMEPSTTPPQQEPVT